MPKKARDYSKSCIYQICCRDPDIRDIYVGSTIDLVKRRTDHKSVCNNPNNGKHNLPVYQYIRDNGGWENWQVVQIEKVECASGQDLCQREREVFERLKPSLNALRPKISPEEAKDCKRDCYKAWCEANPERLRAHQKAWETKRVVCEHCHKEVAQSGFKAHQRSKKCLAIQDADL
jgi:hypothetical protein